MFRKIALCIVLALLAHASRVAAGDKNGAGRMLVLRATEQSISAGTPGAVQSKYQFVVVWKSADPPVNFMWRGKNELVACKVQRAHRNTMVNPGTPSHEYMTSFIAPGSKITKDDTLLITPLAGRGAMHGPLPSARRKNALYFSTSPNKWYYCPVKKIDKKQAVMMP